MPTGDDLFAGAQPSPENQLAGSLSGLAARNIYLGTSSWKYLGWIGQLYSEDRYLYRGKVAETRFNRDCLAEYAETFSTVCIDAGYYRFPTEKYLAGLAEQVPEGFRFSIKCTDEITIKKFTNLPRHGERAGKPNENFLNAELFKSLFLKPCHRALGDHLGLVVLEFSRFYPADYERGRDFIDDLDKFLAQLPTRDFQIGTEIRNASFIHPDYFACLASHGVAHVYNSWTGTPPLEEQTAMPGSLTAGDFTAARLLLKPGRKYQQAVDSFMPYDKTREPLPGVRSATADLIRSLLTKQSNRGSYIYVNNRLEGNAINTIAAIVDLLGPAPTP